MKKIGKMNLISKLNSATVDKEFLLKLAKEEKIKFKYENDDFTRILFYNKSRPNHPTVNTQISNGLICELVDGNWEIVCYPLPAFENTKNIPTDVSNFSVFPVYEATIINVYFSRLSKKWMYGTRKSFDISTQEWRDVKYSDFINQFNLVHEDEKRTYIYAFSDARIHLYSNKTSCTLLATIQSDGEYECYDCLDVPAEEAIKNYRDSGLGYILRDGNNSYLLESNLMKSISKILYKPSRHRDRKLTLKYAKNLNDTNYIIVRAFMLFQKEAAELIPSFKREFGILRKIINTFTNYIYCVMTDSKPFTCAYSDTIMEFYKSHINSFNRVQLNRSTKKNIKSLIFEFKIIETLFPILRKYRNNELRF